MNLPASASHIQARVLERRFTQGLDIAMSSEGVTVTGAEDRTLFLHEYPVFESFDDYDLDENLLRGIKPILDGRDTIGQAQIYKVALALGDYLKVRAHACIGGTSIQEDKDKLRDGQHLVVGTPGHPPGLAGTRDTIESVGSTLHIERSPGVYDMDARRAISGVLVENVLCSSVDVYVGVSSSNQIQWKASARLNKIDSPDCTLLILQAKRFAVLVLRTVVL
eukprot:Skav206150  [mRNA]  locus=scaffold1545:58428:62178:- [translate_table: standard]